MRRKKKHSDSSLLYSKLIKSLALQYNSRNTQIQLTLLLLETKRIYWHSKITHKRLLFPERCWRIDKKTQKQKTERTSRIKLRRNYLKHSEAKKTWGTFTQ